ncbi:hypothetical protein B5V90_05335 [Heyndrickxia sporothermodurans]|nr:hypothetical protein B5V90_05335 [Heyndrickxia sporothermodurans]
MSFASFLIVSSFVFSIKNRKILGFCIFEIINSMISGCHVFYRPFQDIYSAFAKRTRLYHHPQHDLLGAGRL